VRAQIGEQENGAQPRLRALQQTPDRSPAAWVEPVPRIALTQQEAWIIHLSQVMPVVAGFCLHGR